MAPPMTPDTWIRVLKAEGVKVSEYPGWRTRSRDSATGLTFGPVRMILNHHTAGRNSRDLVAKNGVPGLPGPLAHIHLAKDGTATMCSAGRANHAGPMAVNAYQSFRDEAAVHPAPSRASGTIDGNDVAYGIETENLGDGEDVYPREQYDAWVRANVAVCRYHGWSHESVACHKETSVEGKIDPRGPVEGYGSRGRFEYTPKQFRADVAERLRHPASWSPGGTDVQDSPAEEETDMPSLLNETNAKDVDLPSGRWVGLAFKDAVLHAGPVVHDTLVHVTLDDRDPEDVTVEGRFYLTDTSGANPSAYQVVTHRGGGGHQFVLSGLVPAGRHLRFQIRATHADGSAVRLLHRTATGPYWAAG